MFASGHTAIFYDYTLRAPVCQSTRTRKMQVVTRKTANSLTSGRRRAIIKVQQQAFTLFSPAYQSDHDARHGRLFSFAGLPASREARMRRHMRRISQAEGSAWLSPPSGQIRGGMVSSLPLYIGKISDIFIQSQTTSFVNPLSVSIPYFAAIGQLQLVDISKIDLNSKIKKFSHSFICGKGYSPPFGGRIAFFLQSVAAIERLLY